MIKRTLKSSKETHTYTHTHTHTHIHYLQRNKNKVDRKFLFGKKNASKKIVEQYIESTEKQISSLNSIPNKYTFIKIK